MLERLLELFFHAKSGVFAGIFLLGTTGVLLTATVSNGVATITITQASASPSASASASASASHSASPTVTATASPTASPSTSPSSSAAPADSSTAAGECSAQAHAMADAVKTVDTAFSHFHTDLMHMRADAKSAKDTVENADKLLKSIRQNAVKAIHATNTCASGKDDEDKDNEQDEDNDENDDNDGHSSSHDGNFVVVLFTNLQSLFGNRTVTVNTTTASAAPSSSPSTTVTGSDPKTIADNAVAAMQVVFDDAKTALGTLATPSPRATRSPKGTAKADVKARNEHGHGSSDREGDD
jgi:hypothetical protein